MQAEPKLRAAAPEGDEWRVPISDQQRYEWLLSRLGVSSDHVEAVMRTDPATVKQIEITWALRRLEDGHMYRFLVDGDPERRRAKAILRLSATE